MASNRAANGADERLPRCILTGASPAYAEALLALLGSLNCNWPGHPPVIVYDLGLDDRTLRALTEAQIPVRSVPPFCPHWRKHFTWKIWACHEAPCDSYLWLDAGIWVLRPLPEAFEMIERMGYFVRSDNTPYADHACPALSSNLGVSPAEASKMVNINAGMHGLHKGGKGRNLIEEAMRLALNEDNLRAVAPFQLHDQSLLTALFHRHFSPLIFVDRLMYGNESGPQACLGQGLWHHRGKVCPGDRAYFVAHARTGGDSHMPERPPSLPSVSLVKKVRIQIAKWRGRCPKPLPRKEVYDGVRD